MDSRSKDGAIQVETQHVLGCEIVERSQHVWRTVRIRIGLVCEGPCILNAWAWILSQVVGIIECEFQNQTEFGSSVDFIVYLFKDEIKDHIDKGLKPVSGVVWCI